MGAPQHAVLIISYLCHWPNELIDLLTPIPSKTIFPNLNIDRSSSSGGGGGGDGGGGGNSCD